MGELTMRERSAAEEAAGPAYWRESDEQMPGLSELRLDELLERAAAAAPDREALVFLRDDGPARRWTYAELTERVDAAARALLASGAGRGSVVAICAANRPEFVFLQLACSRIGAAMVPMNPGYSGAELADILRRSHAQLCFSIGRDRGNDLWATLAEVAAELPELRLRIALDPESGHDTEWEGWLRGAAAIDDAAYAAVRAEARPEDVVQIQFTSGTTGRPKGVRLRSAAFANVGRCTAGRAELEEGCRYVHAMPYFHVGGTIAIALCLASSGTQLTMPRFSPAAMAAAIDGEAATAIHAVPTMMIAVADRAQRDGLGFSALRTVITGGALVPEQTARHWVDTYGVAISNIYGMTETAGPVLQTGPTDPLERALVTVGRPLPGAEVDIVGVGTEQRVAMGEEGEIRFRGWGLMEGYEGDAETTAATVSADGWLRSGDLGRLSPDGYLQVTGRAKDMIIRGGQNIAPVAVEDAIREHVPEVADVSVIGVPDDYYGEAVVAYVLAHPGARIEESELRERLRGRIANYRIPAHVRVVSEFPTTPSGKIQKFRLQEWFSADEGTRKPETTGGDDAPTRSGPGRDPR
ncbi:class I adenylate-forming enzyme family protein [Streptomyces albipurpureus]|uniref:AMP-binding protein n=1 Tax=Streptomyces albipurpureus TaxID=2897419 RepID=A0ABT0UGK5_9ACTN|nr:AMP-binding protein [Streptomyces sp. CWNU-1]MCM2387573.1 AMP-binding protein [Streptomyces sp. CWNU-1]